jgi:chromosome segregation ATPase
MSGRGDIGKTVEELTDHLRLVDHVRALQEGQKEIAEVISALNQRLTSIEAEFRVLKAETQRDALREAQQAVNAAQGSMHDDLARVSTRLAVLEQALRREVVRPQGPVAAVSRAGGPPRSDGSR